MLFDADLNATEEAVARDAAIATAEEHAVPEWIAFARHVVEQVARANEYFISDAVWEAGLGKPPRATALGPVMVWARREGLIAPTDRVRSSKQKGCHGMPRRVWRSLVFEGGS